MSTSKISLSSIKHTSTTLLLLQINKSQPEGLVLCVIFPIFAEPNEIKQQSEILKREFVIYNSNNKFKLSCATQTYKTQLYILSMFCLIRIVRFK